MTIEVPSTERGAASQGGLLYPALPAVARWQGEAVELIDVGSGSRLQAHGVFGQAVRTLLLGGTKGALLEALPPEHPLQIVLMQLAGQPSLTLSAPAALRLAGYHTLFLELTGRCNQRCVHCYAAAGPEVASRLGLETCEAVLADAETLGFQLVQLTGGEPLLCAFLPQLVQRIAASAMGCEIYTNGLLLDETLLDQLGPYRPAFALSYYSHRPEVHDAVTRTAGSHARTKRAIQRTLDRGLTLRVSVIVTEHNAADVEQTLQQLRAMGVPNVSSGRSYATGRGRLYRGALPLQCVDGATQAPAEMPGGRLCVASDGAVYPCIFNRADELGRVTQRTLREIARAPRLRRQDPAQRLQQARGSIPCAQCQLTACALAAVGVS